jgi:hypothetical protein
MSKPKEPACWHLLLKLPKDLQDFLIARLGFGDALTCLRASRDLYFDERRWAALYHYFFGYRKGKEGPSKVGRKEVFQAVRTGVVRELLLRSVYLGSPPPYVTYCAVEAVRIIPNVAFGVRFHDIGGHSRGARASKVGLLWTLCVWVQQKKQDREWRVP